VSLALLAGAFALTACGGGGGGGKTVDAANGTVSVSAEDIKYDVTKITAKPGKLAVTLNQGGNLDHTFTIGDQINLKVAGGTKTATGSLDLKAGETLTYVCTTPGHSNMHGTIEVK
jgi:plastocyanin